MTERIEAITARYDDSTAAGSGVERLSAHGVEAGRIRVLGPATGADRPSQRGTDAGTSRRLGRRFLQGIAIGAAIGAVAGAIILAVVTDAGVGAWLAGALGGAAAGAGLGALTGLQSAPTMSRAWEDTFAPEHRGPVTIAVEVHDGGPATRTARPAGSGSKHLAAEVEDVLRATGAREIRRVRDLAAAEEHLREAG